MRTLQYIIIFCLLQCLSACVSSKKYEALKKENKKLSTDNIKVRADNQKMRKRLHEMENSELIILQRMASMANDSTISAENLARTEKDLQNTRIDLKDLKASFEEYKNGQGDEMGRYMFRLEALHENIANKQDSLRIAQQNLRARELKIKELHALLAKKDSSTLAIKKTISYSLQSLVAKGLSVHIKNGKVYVSLEEKLLFESGKYELDENGRTTIRQIGEVLNTYPDIQVMIEGHTDDVPYISSNGIIKDNWDLSALRSASIVRELSAENKIDPQRLTLAGRGEYAPLFADKSAGARSKNRRIEIILTPKLDELFKFLSN